MKDNDALLMGRLIGRKGIMPAIEALYDIHTWRGALKFIHANNLPLRRTPSKRPMFYYHELVAFDQRFQNVLTDLNGSP